MGTPGAAAGLRADDISLTRPALHSATSQLSRLKIASRIQRVVTHRAAYLGHPIGTRQRKALVRRNSGKQAKANRTTIGRNAADY
jgi:hypothetical protein